MRATGIIRKLDIMGRFSIPKETREAMNWNEGDPVEVFVDGDSVILRKYQPGCVLCGSMEGLIDHPSGKKVCAKCLGYQTSRQAAN